MPRPLNPTVSPLGKAVRQARIDRRGKHDLQTIAELAGCSKTMVSQIERGKVQPSEELLRRLEVALRLQPRSLQEVWLASFDSAALKEERALKLLAKAEGLPPAEVIQLLATAPNSLSEETQWKLSAATAEAFYSASDLQHALLYAHHAVVELLSAELEEPEGLTAAIEFCAFTMKLQAELKLDTTLYEGITLGLLKSSAIPIGTVLEAYITLGVTVNRQYLDVALSLAQTLNNEEVVERINKLLGPES